MSTFMTFSVLTFFQDREICCYSVSCKEKDNIDITLQWLISHSKSGGGASAAPTPPPSSASGKGQSPRDLLNRIDKKGYKAIS